LPRENDRLAPILVASEVIGSPILCCLGKTIGLHRSLLPRNDWFANLVLPGDIDWFANQHVLPGGK